MSDNPKQFKGTTVILPAVNAKETALFYKQKLGFVIDILWENPSYASVSRENVTIDFGEGRKKYAGSGVCYIHVADIDSAYKEMQKTDVEFVGDFADRDYGYRDFRIKDNNGNMLIFGSRLPNHDELVSKHNIA